MSDHTMTARRAREVLTDPATAEAGPGHLRCGSCSALVQQNHQRRHALFHEALAVLAVRVLGPDGP